jgi:hypothetical protein
LLGVSHTKKRFSRCALFADEKPPCRELFDERAPDRGGGGVKSARDSGVIYGTQFGAQYSEGNKSRAPFACILFSNGSFHTLVL